MPRKPRRRIRVNWPPAATPEDRNALGAMLMALEEPEEAHALGLLRLIVTKEWQALKDYHERLPAPDARTHLERAAHAHAWVFRASGENRRLSHNGALLTRIEALAALEYTFRCYQKYASQQEVTQLAWSVTTAYQLHKSQGWRQPSVGEMVGRALAHPSEVSHDLVARLYMRLNGSTDVNDLAPVLEGYENTIKGRALLARLEAGEAA